MAGSIKDLAKYRFEKAEEQILVAKSLLNDEMFSFSMNRSYYAIFHAMRSVNALDDFDSSKHSGVIAHFNQYHVKNGDFDRETSRIIKSASALREQADYEDFYIPTEEEAVKILEKAESFISAVRNYLISNEII